MGLHTGEGRLDQAHYVRLDVHRAARGAAAAHGGQVVLSYASAPLVEQNLPGGVSVRDLGAHRLKNFDEPRHIFQLVIDSELGRAPGVALG